MADKKKDKEKKKDDEKDEKPEPAARDEGEAAPEGEAPARKKLPLKLILIIVAALVVVLGGAGAALFFTGVIGGAEKPAAEDDAHAASGDKEDAKDDGHGGKDGDKEKKSEGSVFYDLGEIMVNISGEGRRQTYLRLVVQLELESEKDKAAIENLKPRIVDNFQTYLRELRLDDLRGSGGLYRLREELLFRVTDAVHPIKVKDVLFQQMLVQ